MISNYTVTGMTCGNCVNHVTEEVKEVEGVKNVSVSLVTKANTINAKSRTSPTC